MPAPLAALSAGHRPLPVWRWMSQQPHGHCGGWHACAAYLARANTVIPYLRSLLNVVNFSMSNVQCQLSNVQCPMFKCSDKCSNKCSNKCSVVLGNGKGGTQ
eukprot:1571120-Amphidinium_carterae.1